MKNSEASINSEINSSPICKGNILLYSYINNIATLGNSIVKYINGHKLSEQLEYEKVYVKSSLEARIRCMSDYAKLTMRLNSDHVILNINTPHRYEWFTNQKRPAEIVREIAELVTSWKNHTCSCQVSVLNLASRKNDVRRET